MSSRSTPTSARNPTRHSGTSFGGRVAMSSVRECHGTARPDRRADDRTGDDVLAPEAVGAKEAPSPDKVGPGPAGPVIGTSTVAPVSRSSRRARLMDRAVSNTMPSAKRPSSLSREMRYGTAVRTERCRCGADVAGHCDGRRCRHQQCSDERPPHCRPDRPQHRRLPERPASGPRRNRRRGRGTAVRRPAVAVETRT